MPLRLHRCRPLRCHPSNPLRRHLRTPGREFPREMAIPHRRKRMPLRRSSQSGTRRHHRRCHQTLRSWRQSACRYQQMLKWCRLRYSACCRQQHSSCSLHRKSHNPDPLPKSSPRYHHDHCRRWSRCQPALFHRRFLRPHHLWCQHRRHRRHLRRQLHSRVDSRLRSKLRRNHHHRRRCHLRRFHQLHSPQHVQTAFALRRLYWCSPFEFSRRCRLCRLHKQFPNRNP